jgi:hypothetical protein
VEGVLVRDRMGPCNVVRELQMMLERRSEIQRPVSETKELREEGICHLFIFDVL